MSSILAQLRQAAAKRAAYHRTLAEISRLPVDVALDVDLYPGDARQIAYRAVYGA